MKMAKLLANNKNNKLKKFIVFAFAHKKFQILNGPQNGLLLKNLNKNIHLWISNIQNI